MSKKMLYFKGFSCFYITWDESYGKREGDREKRIISFLYTYDRVKAPGAILLFSEMKDDDDRDEKVVKLK